MQGTAADLIKLAMIAVQDWLDRERLATRSSSCRCTTSWCSKCRRPSSSACKQELPELMTGVATLAVPLVVDVGVGPNWDEAH